MPKQKTHRAAAKRFRVTATGKIVRKQAGRSHLNKHKTTRQKRRLDAKVLVDPSNLKKIRLELPYLKYCR